MAAAVPVAALGVAAYSAYQAHAASVAAGMVPVPQQVPTGPLNANANSTLNAQQADLRAQTAGGTILSNPNQDQRRQIGSATGVMKTVIGT